MQMETRSAKKRKLRFPEQNNTGEDRITDLPNAILHHILCLLPIKSIVQTSVLSKRWMTLWYTFPDLDFTTIIPSGTTLPKFVYLNLGNVINNILSLREKLSDVRTLRFYAFMTFSGLHALIRSAIRLQVQELDIRVATKDTFNFPRSIITSDCLRVLKVNSCSGFRLPPSRIMRSGFQKLRTLSLSFVYLDNNQSSLLDLFTDCSFPQLTKLSLDSCFNLKQLRVGCHLLEEVVLENCSSLQGLEIASPRLETLRVSSCFDALNMDNTWVQIDAPRLNTIVWANNSITSKSCVQNLECLHKVTIGLIVNQENLDEDKLQNVSSFVSGLSHTESLVLESRFLEIMSKNIPLATIFFHPFMKLKSLELQTSEVLGLASLLKICPLIHTLIIKISEGYKAERRWNRHWVLLSKSLKEKFWESHTKELKPLLCYLKTVKIHGFSDSENDISLVKFLLKHGKVLEDLIICLRDNNSRGYYRHEKFKSLIMGFSRASLDAKVEFS